MNNIYIGLICIIVGIFLDSILPIIFQTSNIEIFSYLFLISIVFILLSTIHLFIFNKKKLYDFLSIISNKKNYLKIIFYGSLRYIRYLLFTFGGLSVQTGVYNALASSSLIYLVYSNSRDNHIKIILPQLSGFFIISIGIGIIIYNSLVNEKSKISKNFIYGVCALILALMMNVKDDIGFKSITEQPYEDILLSSIITFIIASIIIFFRIYYLKKKFGVNSFNHLLYLIFVPIIITQYIPTLLEYASYDYLPIIIILIFFGIQPLIGFILDKFYYKSVFTITKYFGILILISGIIYSIYGYYLENKKKINDKS